MMSSFQVVGSSPTSGIGVMETSNFAHVIFQNVRKSFLPQEALECHYTLTSYITPNPKDWVGIFKVGWNTARDYYTFLWSPMPENYQPGSTVHRAVVFQGYYVPKSDGEFYQLCYVTHMGDIRGASTPFLFRPATPTEDCLTVTEDDSNSDILVVTTKSSVLEQRVEEAQQERRELLKRMHDLQEEKQQLQEEHRRLHREREQERETCYLLRTHNQELLRSSQGLSEEREEVRRRLQEATDRVRQLEEDLLGVTQKGLQKETELDCLRDRLKKLTAERDSLETQLKNDKDERDLYKGHLRSTELENTKLSAELQMLKAVELNREVTIAQFQEELDRLRACITQKDRLEKELHTHAVDKAEMGRLREQLRQCEEQLQASRQQAAMLASELRDSANTRDRTMTELYRARLEADALRASLADAQAECRRMETQLDHMRTTSQQEVGVGTSSEGGCVVSEAEAELQREVEEMKLRLHMAAEHYKEKYRECQRLRRQVAKISEAQGESKRNAATETTQEPLTPSPESPTAGNLSATGLRGDSERPVVPKRCDKNREHTHTYAQTDAHTNTHTNTHTDTHTNTFSGMETMRAGEKEWKRRNGEEMEREVSGEEEGKEDGSVEEERKEDRSGGEERKEDRSGGEERKEDRSGGEESMKMESWVEVENERKSAEEVDERSVEEDERRSAEEVEKEQTCSVEEELARMEEKWAEQCAINETLKQRLANEEERFRIQMVERAMEVTELKESLAQALREKNQLKEELQQCQGRQREQEADGQGSEVKQPVLLRYPLPYPQDPSPPPLVPQRPAELQYGNPYSTDNTRDGADGALSPEQMLRPPPEAPGACAPPAPSPTPGADWEREVVCIQPSSSRSMSPPDGLEHSPEEPRNVGDGEQPACNHQASSRLTANRSSFCFDPSGEVHKRCPLCEVIFPPHFEQRSFEQHVESHWKVCPVCSEQFPLDCHQQLFQKHVLTHFDGHVLNFANME
ncbi:tax1-binding protein 1 homolog A isoform X2 [Salmo salar]|uniref:Tax1-binding protein 1 homolog A isoform X2 n=1 Tax=Salmo salar TaxID=8030 RepID=A0A1S3M5T0_SALSA|nr:tax1-binding protein 1 homolog A isoform X2 [Salmo salar]